MKLVTKNREEGEKMKYEIGTKVQLVKENIELAVYNIHQDKVGAVKGYEPGASFPYIILFEDHTEMHCLEEEIGIAKTK